MNLHNEIYNFGYDRNFLFKDKQLGQNVIVDGVNVYDKFDADNISVSQIAPSINKDVFKNLGKTGYNINTFSLDHSGMELKFYVGGHTYNEAQLNVNGLIKQFINKVTIVKMDESDFEYICVLDSFSSEYTGVEFYYLVTIVVVAIKRLPMITIDLNSSYFSSESEVEYEFENEGVVESGIDIIVRFGGDTTFTIRTWNDGLPNDITFSDLSTSNYFYKIGGQNGVVQRSSNIAITSSVTNVFLKTDLIDFPIVNSGTNRIKFIQSEPGKIKQARLQYYPVFYI